MLWYKLTMAVDTWFTVAMSARADRGDNQSVLHQILALFVANKSEQKLLHN